MSCSLYPILRYNTSMKRRSFRSLLAVSVLLITFLASVYFLRHHPNIIQQLQQTPSTTLVGLLGLYVLFIGSLWLIFRSSLVMCNVSLPPLETLLVTAYSSVINFFGPLQSGPAFRALYLKKRHQVGLKKYALASLVYYFFYAGFSAVFLLVGIMGWWAFIVGIIGLGLGYGCLQLPIKRLQGIKALQWRGIALTAGSTFLQVCLLVIIFYFELHSINQAITLQQAVIYTGAANFALFVSITPAAIGFRESFVLLSQHLHHIPNATSVAASLIDRGVYVVMLLLLSLFIFSTQARPMLKRLTS